MNGRNASPAIFSDIVKELTSAQAAASAIAKALVESEHELVICMEVSCYNFPSSRTTTFNLDVYCIDFLKISKIIGES